MRLLISTLLMALALSFAGPVYAQDSCTDNACPLVEEDPTPSFDPELYTRYRLPEGRRCVVGGETFQCFDLAEYRTLLEMDVDLQFYDEAYPVAQATIATFEGIERDLRVALDATHSEIVTLSSERDRLYDRWVEENRLRLEAENRPMLGSFLGWGLAAAGAVAVFVLSLVIGLGG